MVASVTSPMLVRVQDATGRGPWRPGFSDSWVSKTRVRFLPPIYSELGMTRFKRIVEQAHTDGLHVGCAVSLRRLHEWFSDDERTALIGFGFRLVKADCCKHLATTQTQRLIGSPCPLSELPEIEWKAKGSEP
jgi:hypothetical protein